MNNKSRACRFFAGAVAVILTLPAAAFAQGVVVPIPSSGNETPAASQPVPPANVPAAPVTTPEAAKPAASAPAITVQVPDAKPAPEKSVAAEPAPAPSAEKAPAVKAMVPTPPVKEPRASAQTDNVPLPRSAPSTASRAPLPMPAPKAVSASPAAAASAEAAADSAPKSDAANAAEPAIAKPQLSEADAQVAARLQETIADSKQLAKRVGRTSDRAAVTAFYGARDYAPLWTHDGRLTDRAKAAIARMKDADADGLDPASYRVADFPAGNPAALAAADLTLTNAVLTFARHLSDGRITPSRIYEQVDYGDHTPAPADILKTILDANNVAAAFDGFNPQDRGFRALKRKLAELRGRGDESHKAIPSGRPIKPGAKDERVPMLRARLGLKGKPTDLTYDGAVLRAVRKLQAQHGINASGIVGPETLGVLNEPKSGQAVDRVIANMERWRWMPRELGATYVMVNIPDYSLKLVHNNRTVWTTKIVAGKPETPTPLASAVMDNVIVNPSWHVPQSIIQNELLPRYQEDPNIFERMGLEVKRGKDGNLVVVQPPGAANALGQIKFNFPNRFQVYLHDTPQKSLFKHERRAFSHGCMRVENPAKFGEHILQLGLKRSPPNAKQIEAMFGSEERVFRLAERPQVHLTYQTAFVDDAGKLQLRDDVYGFDGRITDILHGKEPRPSIVSKPQEQKREARAELSNEDLLRRIERRENMPPPFNPLRLFDGIFR